MARKGKAFSINTEPSKDIVVDGLTRDATVEACIFDLIDNSIDAARNTYFERSKPAARQALAESYKGFFVELSIGGDGLKIEDNCGGIPVQHLKTMVLRFGQRSQHDMGIGAFGVGLNRAIFKLGRLTHLRTDTGKQRAELVLKKEDYLKSEDWNLPAEEFQSTGTAGTEIEIRQVPDEIAHQFADKGWIDTLRHEIGRRYGRFIEKDLVLRVNKVAAKNEEVPLRENGPYGEYKFYKTENGVTIHVQYGQHRDHRFRKERDYSEERNRTLTDQYGWNVLCNDRAIKMSDTSDKTGWETKFHSEFYGFVGFVRFECAEPAKLPWNTTKTDVDLNNHAYRMALTDMRKFAEQWRVIANARKKGPAPKPIPAKPKKLAGPPAKAKPGSSKTAPIPKPVVKEDHNQFRTVLPNDINQQHCFDKHLALVHEAMNLDLVDNSYTGMALIRMIFECSVATHLHRHGKYDELRKFAVDRRKKKGMKIEDEKKVQPTIDEMLPFLDNNPDVWGAKQNNIKHSLKKMAGHQSTLNSAIHNAFQPISRTIAIEIRDEVLPMLRHLIET